MINEYNDNKASSPAGYGAMGLNRVVKTVSQASSKIKNSLDDFLSVEDVNSSSSLDNFLQDEAPSKSREIIEDEQAQIQALNRLEQQRSYSQEVSAELQQQIKSQNHQIELLEQKLFELTSKISESHVDKREARGISTLKNILRSLDLKEGITQSILKKAHFELTKEELEIEDTVFEFGLKEINEMIRVDFPLFSSASTGSTPVVTAIVSESSCGQSSMAMKLGVLQEDVKIIRFREQELDQANSNFTAQFFKLNISTVNSLSQLMSEARKSIQNNQSIILDLKLNFKDSDETKKFIDTLKRSFDTIEVLVNISAIQSEIYNRKILSKYNQFSNGVIISYMDQCLSFGSLINLHFDFNDKPLKFYGTGPTVPDDIEAATAERILAGMFQL